MLTFKVIVNVLPTTAVSFDPGTLLFQTVGSLHKPLFVADISAASDFPSIKSPNALRASSLVLSAVRSPGAT